jgi:hypothetical protein
LSWHDIAVDDGCWKRRCHHIARRRREEIAVTGKQLRGAELTQRDQVGADRSTTLLGGSEAGQRRKRRTLEYGLLK